MIKVFLHISVHIGTKLSELAFPGTERYTRGRESYGLTPTGAGSPGQSWAHRTPLSETSMGERAGLCHLESSQQTLRDSVHHSLALQMRKEAQRGELAPMPQSKLKDGAGFALSSRGPHCPERGRLTRDPCGGLGGTGGPVGVPQLARWVFQRTLYGCTCPSAPALSPRAREGAVSLSGRARLSSSYAPAQLREPGWRPGGGGGVDSKGLPQSSVQAAQAIRHGMEQEGQRGAYRKLFPDHQSSQRPPGWLERGVGGRGFGKRSSRRTGTVPATAPPSGRRRGVTCQCLVWNLRWRTFLEPPALTHRETKRRGYSSKVKLSIPAGQSLGPGLWVRTIPLQFAHQLKTAQGHQTQTKTQADLSKEYGQGGSCLSPVFFTPPLPTLTPEPAWYPDSQQALSSSPSTPTSPYPSILQGPAPG